MEYKIVQIIPAPGNMNSVYKHNFETEEFRCKVVCLALIEYDDGEREIVPMDMTEGDGLIDKIGDGFKCMEYVG